MYIEDLLEKLNKVHEDFGNVKIVSELNVMDFEDFNAPITVYDEERFDVDSIRSPGDYSDNSKKKIDTVILYISK